MHAKNVHHEQSHHNAELQRQQQQQQQQQKQQLSHELYSKVHDALNSLDTLRRELHQEMLNESQRGKFPSFEEALRSTIDALTNMREKLQDLLKESVSEGALPTVAESTSRGWVHTCVGWLRRLDSALFSPPHTFASVLVLVIAQLELYAADSEPQ